MNINDWLSTDSYLYHLAVDLPATFREALESERKAEAKAAQMRGKG